MHAEDAAFRGLRVSLPTRCLQSSCQGLFLYPWNRLSQTRHLDTVDKNTLTAAEALCPAGDVAGAHFLQVLKEN